MDSDNSSLGPEDLPKPPKKSKFSSFLKKAKREAIIFSCIALVLMAIKSSIYEPFRIPSGSMIPTLKIGDFILVNKMAYGIRFPFSDFLSLSDQLFIYRNNDHQIQRGDVIVFKFPKNKKVNYIKRVIGLPGDKLKIVDKKVFINGKVLPVEKAAIDINQEKDLDPRYRGSNFDYYESKLESTTYRYQLDKDNYFKVDYDEVSIPEGHYFVLGDNRDFSNDSRYWGFVPAGLVKGKAELIWLSIGKGRGAQETYYFRTERFGKKI